MAAVARYWQHLGLVLKNKGVIRHSRGRCSLGDGGTQWCEGVWGASDERGLLCVGDWRLEEIQLICVCTWCGWHGTDVRYHVLPMMQIMESRIKRAKSSISFFQAILLGFLLSQWVSVTRLKDPIVYCTVIRFYHALRFQFKCQTLDRMSQLERYTPLCPRCTP